MTELEQKVLNLKNDLTLFLTSTQDDITLSDNTIIKSYKNRIEKLKRIFGDYNSAYTYEMGDIYTYFNRLYYQMEKGGILQGQQILQTGKVGIGFKEAFKFNYETNELVQTNGTVLNVVREADTKLITVYFNSSIDVNNDVFCGFAEHTNVLDMDIFSIGTASFSGVPNSGGYNVEQRLHGNIRYDVPNNAIRLKFSTGVGGTNLSYNPVVNCVIV